MSRSDPYNRTLAFAEEPQLTDQEVLEAWGQARLAVEPISLPSTLEGKQLLTNEELGQITGAGLVGFNGGSLPPFFQTFRGCIECTVNLTAEGQQEYAFLKFNPPLKGNARFTAPPP